ncbi:mRNA-capping enzyme-like isoform X2 [Daphnia pulicaria]|uniref:mRNA-capping enzyme-like isoform X2 n=1 Tax=Daphnia pulicaria TaxID=35523 RepID=UPI001EEC6CE5|nr:mRNA-capping enzyme-like isoform X2 [Daphnia pulicaria]
MSRKRHLDDGPGPIPQRWLHCPRKAFSTVGGTFLAFKTPLDARYENQVDDEYTFHPEMVFSSVKNMKMKIGLWIDLTNTSRFYDKNVVEKNSCKYVKLKCKGHGETPNPETVDLFIKQCTEFISQNPLEIIGVHCTHGFNRTGFLIVSYLVQAMDWSVEAAVNEFSKARPPGIYKEDYIRQLFTLYGDIDDTTPAPALPMWHCEADDDTHIKEETEAVDDDDQAGGSTGDKKKKPRREAAQAKAKFMEGIPNVNLVTDMEITSRVQKRIKNLTGLKSSGFTGCQPVSMDRRNIQLLNNPYKVSWKADGTRYMMFVMGQEQVYFIDRDNAVFQIEGVSFFSSHDGKRHLVDTLVDGEMVIDKADGMRHPRYLIYDLVSLEGNKVFQEHFTIRYRTIMKEIIEPRVVAMKSGRIIREREPIGIRRKDFWDLPATSALLGEKFMKKLGHEPDGLVFQPIEESYTPGQCPSVLKWKPPSHNSVDFRLEIVIENRPGMLRQRLGYLFVGGKNVTPFAIMKATKEMVPLDNKIVECRFEMNNGKGKWVFMRERTDKSFPNSFNTATAVCRSIREPVTKEMLEEFILNLRRMSPPPPPQRRPH